MCGRSNNSIHQLQPTELTATVSVVSVSILIPVIIISIRMGAGM